MLGFKDSLWHKPGEIILKEFYKAAGKEHPLWIELCIHKMQVQDSNEEKHFELVGFLRHIIQEAYRANIYTDPDPGSIIEDSDGNPFVAA